MPSGGGADGAPAQRRDGLRRSVAGAGLRLRGRRQRANAAHRRAGCALRQPDERRERLSGVLPDAGEPATVDAGATDGLDAGDVAVPVTAITSGTSDIYGTMTYLI